MNSKNEKERKNKYIKVLVTEDQKAEIESAAKKCHKSVSAFLCERGLGYEPKHYLTEKELKLMESLQTIIIELTRFTNIVSGKAKGLKDPKTRIHFLSSFGIISTWKQKLDVVLDFLYAMISNVNFRHVYNNDR